MENVEIARALREVADLLELRNENPFKVRAYRNAARTVEGLSRRVAELVEAGEDLEELPAVGKDMAAYITELVRTGRLRRLEQLEKRVPHGLAELTQLEGVGPRKAMRLHEELGVDSIADLEKAIRAGEVEALPGFGRRSAAKMLQAIRDHRRHLARFKLSDADQLVRPILEHMRAAPGIEELEVAGSYRRRVETIGDVDVLAAARKPAPVMDHFTAYPGATRVESAGPTRGTIVLNNGMHVDLRVVKPESWGAALHYFTGSKAHNIKVRTLGIQRGLKINEYGIFRETARDGGSTQRAAARGKGGARKSATARKSAAAQKSPAARKSATVQKSPAARKSATARKPATRRTAGRSAARKSATRRKPGRGRALPRPRPRPRPGPVRLGGARESDVFRAVGMDFVPPELREDRGEVEAALRHELPRLVTLDDIRGDLQVHSTWSDGRDTIEAMVRAAKVRGYEYVAITDHSPAVAVAGGLKPKDLTKQWKEIDRVARKVEGITVLKGMEVDILADGSLDLPDEWLERLDVVLVAVHSRLTMPSAKMTDRVIKGISHPGVHILAHPTGRLINRREPSRLDMDAVLEAAAELGVAVEIDAQPDRLDLSDVHAMRARELGVMISIDTDAHSVNDLRYMAYGVAQARRAWLEERNVVNTMPLARLRKWLERRR